MRGSLRKGDEWKSRRDRLRSMPAMRRSGTCSGRPRRWSNSSWRGCSSPRSGRGRSSSRSSSPSAAPARVGPLRAHVLVGPVARRALHGAVAHQAHHHGGAVRRRDARVEALGRRQHPRAWRHPAAHREGDGRHHQPRDGAARPPPAVPGDRRLDGAVRRPVRHGLGHHVELPGHRRLEEHQPRGRGARHRRSACSPPRSACSPPFRRSSSTTSSPPTAAQISHAAGGLRRRVLRHRVAADRRAGPKDWRDGQAGQLREWAEHSSRAAAGRRKPASRAMRR